jgi:hypothetical protein
MHRMNSKQLIDTHGGRSVGGKGLSNRWAFAFRRWELRYQSSIQWSAAPITAHLQMQTSLIKKPCATPGYVSRHRMVAEHLGSVCILQQLSTLVAHVQVQEGPCMTSEPLPHVEDMAAIHLVMFHEHTLPTSSTHWRCPVEWSCNQPDQQWSPCFSHTLAGPTKTFPLSLPCPTGLPLAPLPHLPKQQQQAPPAPVMCSWVGTKLLLLVVAPVELARCPSTCQGSKGRVRAVSLSAASHRRGGVSRWSPKPAEL